MEFNHVEYAKIFKVLSDPKRLKIVSMLADGELCACEIQESFNITQPTLSHDMKLLCDAGLVESRKEGKWCHYSLKKEKLSEICCLMETILQGKPVITCDCSK